MLGALIAAAISMRRYFVLIPAVLVLIAWLSSTSGHVFSR
jgi:hypothetical protein